MGKILLPTVTWMNCKHNNEWMKADTDVRFQKCSKVFCSHFLEKTKQGEDHHKTHIVGVRWVQKEQLRLSVSCAPEQETWTKYICGAHSPFQECQHLLQQHLPLCFLLLLFLSGLRKKLIFAITLAGLDNSSLMWSQTSIAIKSENSVIIFSSWGFCTYQFTVTMLQSLPEALDDHLRSTHPPPILLWTSSPRANYPNKMVIPLYSYCSLDRRIQITLEAGP